MITVAYTRTLCLINISNAMKFSSIDVECHFGAHLRSAVLAKGVPSAGRQPVQRDFCLSDNKSVNSLSFREREVYHRFMEGKKQTVDVDGSPAITRDSNLNP